MCALVENTELRCVRGGHGVPREAGTGGGKVEGAAGVHVGVFVGGGDDEVG